MSELVERVARALRAAVAARGTDGGCMCIQDDERPEEAEALARAAIAAMREPAGWQPIDTAPKDGSEFDGWGLYLPDSGKEPDDPNPERLTECFWGKRDSSYVRPKEGWCSTGHDGWSWAVRLTHWMPKPGQPGP